MEDKKGMELILIIAILGFILLFIILPDFWFVYMLLGVGLGLFVERKLKNNVDMEYEQEREISQLKENMENKRISDDDLIRFSNGNRHARLAIAEGLSENFDKFNVSAKIIEKFSEDKDEDVRDKALYAFQQNFFKFLNPSDIFEKFLNVNNYNYTCDYAIKLINIMDDNFEKIDENVREYAVINLTKSNLKIYTEHTDPADLIGKSALGMMTYPIDVKERLAEFIYKYFDRIKNRTEAINILLEEALKIKIEDEEGYADFIVSVARCLEKCNKNQYTKIQNAQDFVERFSRSMDEDIVKVIAKIVEKNFENIKNLPVILENLAYSQNYEVKAIVRKILRKDMENYDKILKILET